MECKRIMKTKSMILVGVLIIALVAMAAPVMGSETASTTVSGSITKTVSLSALSSTTSINLGAGAGSPTAEATFTADENCVGFISAVDDYGTYNRRTVESGVRGYMSNYSTAGSDYVNTAPFTRLEKKISLLGSDNSPLSNAGIISDLSVSTPLYTFTGPGTATTTKITFTQELDHTKDLALPTNYQYQIPVILTIACS